MSGLPDGLGQFFKKIIFIAYLGYKNEYTTFGFDGHNF